ncbi:MAG: Signal transduction histidine-protein kinase BarA [Verrucomicrobiales bacterium]|nr:Signal transduction histidine-protein kinase BarA [Verrucomicrobiales bacterium]
MEAPPVDTIRLLDLTDGDREEMREFVELYLQQTSEQLAGLKAAIEERAAEKIRLLAHTGAGASATCGITSMETLLREMEMCARNKTLNDTPALLERAEIALRRVREFFEDYFEK